MTNGLLRLHTLTVLAGFLGSFCLQAQETNIAFEDGCSRQSPEEMRPRVLKKLDELEAALSGGDLGKARTAKSEAEGATTDVAGWTGALAMKCLNDQQIYRRYFVASQELLGLEARSNPQDVASHVQSALWQSINDGDGSAGDILADIPGDYRNYRVARDYLNRAADGVASHREVGAFVLPEETEIERQARQAIDLLDTHARQRSGEALAKETETFYREPTEFEKEGVQTLENLGEFAGAMAGLEMNTAEQTDYQLARQRIQESREQLRDARGWEIGVDSGAASSPVNQRAAKRGDEVLSWAENEKLSFTIRDEYYERALDYYNFCQCKDKTAPAVAAREAIQPQLQAEQARRQAQADEAGQRLKGQAEELQRAMDDLQKTEAEKKAFEEEADALEAELGF